MHDASWFHKTSQQFFFLIFRPLPAASRIGDVPQLKWKQQRADRAQVARAAHAAQAPTHTTTHTTQTTTTDTQASRHVRATTTNF